MKVCITIEFRNVWCVEAGASLDDGSYVAGQANWNDGESVMCHGPGFETGQEDPPQ